MKTNVIIAIASIILVAILAACGVFGVKHGKQEYFCIATGKIYHPFETKDAACEKFKDDAAKLERCQDKFDKTVKAYKAGKCSEIIRDTLTIDGSSCKVTYTKDKKSYFTYSCTPRSPEVTKKLKELYGRH